MLETASLPAQPVLWDDTLISQGNWDEYKSKADAGSDQLMKLSLAYLLSQDPAMFVKAKAYLMGWSNLNKLQLVDQHFREWNHSHPLDSVAISVALAYDFLYNHPGFTQAEKDQVLAWLQQAGVFIKFRHEAAYRLSNQKAWDDAALMLIGLARQDTTLVNYVLNDPTHSMSMPNLIAGMIQPNGQVCDSWYGCYEFWHSLLALNGFVLISAAAFENGYGNFFVAQPKLITALGFYAPIFRTNDVNSLPSGFNTGTHDWIYFSGVYEIAHRYLPGNATIRDVLTNPDLNFGDGRLCGSAQGHRSTGKFYCSRWTRYPLLIWGTLEGTHRASMPLVTGWNLIALPLHPTDSSLLQVLSSIAGQYSLVYAYNGCDVADPWKKYDPNAPPYVNDLTQIDETLGFWIKMNIASTLTVTGTNPSPQAMALCTGWNLVSYPRLQTQPIATALASIAGRYNLVYAYDASDMNDPWKKYDPDAPPYANDLTEMRAGRGYWIRANQNCSWMFTQ